MLVGLYPRVSTQEQAKDGYSIGEQTERLQKYCEAMGWTVYKTYTDAGYSGGNTDRPALQEMIRDVKAGKLDKVVVYKLDRLSRSQLDTLYLIEKVFLANGCDFVSMNENFDTSTPFGRAMIGILAVFAQLEREQIKERMMMGKEARAKEGKFHGSNNIPFGYDYTNGELIPNEFEAVQIRKIFELAQNGLSPYSIAKKMTEHGYVRRDGIPWKDISVRRSLLSKYYIGYIHHHGEWISGIHDAIIDQSQFYDVQKIMKVRTEQHQKHNRRAGKATTYLGGFLYCSKCGAKYTKNTSCSKPKPDGSQYRYEFFGCNSRNKRGRTDLVKDKNCKNKNWKSDVLTDSVFAEIRKLALDPEYINEVNTIEVQDDSPLIEQEIVKIDEQLSRLMDLYTFGNMPVDVLQDKIHALNDKKIKLQNELEQLKMEQVDIMSKHDALKLVSSFEDVLAGGDFDAIRQVIAGLIERIEIDGDEFTIRWNFA